MASTRALVIACGLALAAAVHAQPTSVFAFSGLAPVYAVGETIEFEAVNTVPLAVTFCGSVVQRERLDGQWVNADTLTCVSPRPSDGRLSDTGTTTLHTTLHGGISSLEFARGGSGRFRVALIAADAEGRLVPELARASPPFRVDGSQPEALPRIDPDGFRRLPAEARATYAALLGFKAIAVGTTPSGETVWGYGSRNQTAAGAASRAMAECTTRTRPLGACVLAAVDAPEERRR